MRRDWDLGTTLAACALIISACGSQRAADKDAAVRGDAAGPSRADAARADAARDGAASTGQGPTVLYERPGGTASAIATDGTFLYWREATFTDSAIFQAPRDGSGPVIRLGPTTSSGLSVIATDETHVYWLGSDSAIKSEDSCIRKAPKGGGAVTQIQLNGDYHAGVLAMDDDHLYVTKGNCQAIARVAKSGGTVTRIDNPSAELLGGATSLLVDDTRIYCGSGGDGRIFAGDKLGTELETILRIERGDERKVIGRIALVHDMLYVPQVRSTAAFVRYEILRLPASGGEVEQIAAYDDGRGGAGFDVSPDGSRLYFLTGENDSYVLASFDIATRQRTTTKVPWTQHGVALSNTHAYWINADLNTSFIMSAPAH